MESHQQEQEELKQEQKQQDEPSKNKQKNGAVMLRKWLATATLEEKLSVAGLSDEDFKVTVKTLKSLLDHKYLLRQFPDVYKYASFLVNGEDREVARVKRRKRRRDYKHLKLAKDRALLSKTKMKKQKQNEKKRAILCLPDTKLVEYLETQGSINEDQKEHLLTIDNVAEREQQLSEHIGIRTKKALPYLAKHLDNDTKKTEEDELDRARPCHICNKSYTKVHHFYDQMCLDCGELNYKKRFETADLTDKVAIVTGGRVKIGFHICTKLLRAGATVICTTRFPKDAALRFSKENDFDVFKDRLQVYGLDLRHLPSVIAFCDHVKTKYPRLDILINNAAQTVRRSVSYYHHLLPTECKPRSSFDESIQTILPTDFNMVLNPKSSIENQKQPEEDPSTPQKNREQIVPTKKVDPSPPSTFTSTNSTNSNTTTTNPNTTTNTTTTTTTTTTPTPIPSTTTFNTDQSKKNDQTSQISLRPFDTMEDVAEAHPHLSMSALLSQLRSPEGHDDNVDVKNVHPHGALDHDHIQIDYSKTNSWELALEDVSLFEYMEVQTINMTAPFLLCKHLRPFMAHHPPDSDAYIINVSAMEGKFYRLYKTQYHPHTNMAKAALNMMTRTSGQDFAKDRIWMNAVDTGFVTFEKPALKNYLAFMTVPLDSNDGASRVLDPIWSGENDGVFYHSQFLKNYERSYW